MFGCIRVVVGVGDAFDQKVRLNEWYDIPEKNMICLGSTALLIVPIVRSERISEEGQPTN